MQVRATSRILAVIGDPVAHSLSPVMQNRAIAMLGLDAVYVALHATAATFETAARGVLAVGGALNVTVPFKRQAAAFVASASGSVQRTGACNTVWGRESAPEGDNTDIAGVREAARAVMNGGTVRRAVLVGTGGSSRAAAVAVSDEWPGAEVVIVSRDEGRAREFVAWAGEAGVACRVWGAAGSDADLLVNATPLGLRTQDPLPCAPTMLKGMTGVLDLVYVKGETALVRAARAAGARAADGRGVLVAQGAAAFQRFFGVSAPVEVMRAAVEDALRP